MSATSTSEARTEPPADSRIHEARAQGHVPRAELAGVVAVFLTLTLLLAVSRERLLEALRSLLREPLRALAAGEVPSLQDALLGAMARLGSSLLFVLSCCLLSVVATLVLAQGVRFRLAVGASKARFAKVESTRIVRIALSGLVCFAAFAGGLFDLLRVLPSELSALLVAGALRFSLLLSLLAVVDTLLSRAAWWRSLWMTRRDRLREEREAFGTPEMRAARQRLRREDRTQPASRSGA